MRCPNCDATIEERYCSRCGQDRRTLEPRLSTWLRDSFVDSFGIDGSIWRTLALLFARPGALTVEFMAGRRARYVSPLRLYAAAALVFFSLGALLPVEEGELTGFVAGFTAGFADTADGSVAVSEWDTYMAGVGQVMQRLMIVLLPLSALLCVLLFRRREQPFLQYLVFAFHFHVFYFLIRGAAYLLPDRLQEGASLVIGIALIGYIAAAARRVFGYGWIGGTLRATVVVAAYGISLGLIAVLVGVIYVRL